MNIMCIIIYSPSATNTATESYMTTYSINAKSKALKQKKKPVFLKRTLTYAEKTVFYFFFFHFLPASLNLNSSWKQYQFSKVLMKVRKILYGFLVVSSCLAH